MKQYLSLTVLIFLSQFVYCQSPEAVKNYEKGTEAIQAEKFQEAILFLTKSIDEYPTADAYFNRAVAHSNMFDSCNFCLDLANASNLGDKEAEKLYFEECFVNDTIREVADSIFEEYPGYSYSISKRTVCSDQKYRTYRNSKGEDIKSVWLIMPTYPGGDIRRNKFLAENIVYPMDAVERGYQGTVYVSFVIESDGRVSDIKLLRGPGGGLNEEALRVVGLMPKWKPGTRKGKPVKVLFNMPIYFKLQG